MKPKEPLLAALLTFVYPGLGQIYAGFKNRGILFLTINAVVTFVPYIFIVPYTKTIEQALFDPATKKNKNKFFIQIFHPIFHPNLKLQFYFIML